MDGITVRFIKTDWAAVSILIDEASNEFGALRRRGPNEASGLNTGAAPMAEPCPSKVTVHHPDVVLSDLIVIERHVISAHQQRWPWAAIATSV